jgi:Flp pilus assembly pilin Flp
VVELFYLRIVNALRALNDEKGQDVVEYALLVLLVAVALVAVFPQVANAVSTALGKAVSELTK